jgi:putative DNA primase/helicase
MTLVSGKLTTPTWLTDDAPFAAAEVLPCHNALVHIPTLVSGGNAILPPTPSFFGTYALNYDFDAHAPKPTAWLNFLDSVWGDDPDTIATAQEWFGYCLTEDTRQQKIAALIGPKRAGKDTIARILRAMIGPDNVAGPTLSSLATNFGLWPLIGKPLAVISDARLGAKSDTATIVERLLTISGEGTLTIDRKNLAAWTGKLSTRMMLISNELPRLPDSAGALPGRLILLRLTKSFYGKEDRTLFDRLLKELPGILLWAIEGWRRLNERGFFVQPKSGNDLLEQIGDLASPESAFVRERCEVGPGFEIETKELFQAWTSWCESIGKARPGDSPNFGRNLGAAVPSVRTMPTRRAENGIQRQMRVYVGIKLKSQADY